MQSLISCNAAARIVAANSSYSTGGLEAATRLTPAPLVFPSVRGGLPEAHPVVPMIQARADQFEQRVELPDELCENTIRK